MRSRATVLETAILGGLSMEPLHGYELRKLLSLQLGPFRAFSYGTLYPALKSLQERGLICATGTVEARTRGGRNRIVYEMTATGRAYLHDLLRSSGPSAWDDDTFDIRFALFGQTDADTRLRILEGRRARLEEKAEKARINAARADARVDEYSRELQRYGLEQVERELRWLDRLISTERGRVIDPNNPKKERG
jgi:DNA-binding PadR family transcriptional regulator